MPPIITIDNHNYRSEKQAKGDFKLFLVGIYKGILDI